MRIVNGRRNLSRIVSADQLDKAELSLWHRTGDARIKNTTFTGMFVVCFRLMYRNSYRPLFKIESKAKQNRPTLSE